MWRWRVRLEAATKEALVKLGMEDTIDYVTDFLQIAAYGSWYRPKLKDAIIAATQASK